MLPEWLPIPYKLYLVFIDFTHSFSTYEDKSIESSNDTGDEILRRVRGLIRCNDKIRTSGKIDILLCLS